MPMESTALGHTSSDEETSMPSRRFVAAIVTLGGMQLMSMMNGTITIAALPKIQNELNLSDAGRSWVLTAYLLAYGGLMLVGGRVGDTIGRKRAFIGGVALFTITSAVCGIAQNGGTLIAARLLEGVAGAVIAPTTIALVATTFPKGPTRNTAMAVLGAMGSVSSVLSLVVGGALADLAWRLVFLVNVPVGLFVIYLARTALRETQLERMKLDVAGAALATLTGITAVVALSLGPEKGWLSAPAIGAGVLAIAAFAAFIMVERTAENPIVPFDLFFDRNRLATFATIFLAGGLLFSLTVLVTLYALNIMGYTALRAGLGFIPFALAVGVGVVASSKLVTRFPPRVLVVAGGMLLVSTMLYSSTFHRGIPYFPNLVVPLVIGGIGIGLANVPLGLSVIASVGQDRIGPTSAISLMLLSLGGPVVMAVIQAIVTSHTLSLGGVNGPAKSMNAAQLHALDQGYTYGLLWLAGVSVLVGVVALMIGYTAEDVARAQEVRKAMDSGEL
ncbi:MULTISPECIES: MFS transporter [unclassified Mycobacterium]|uniref:MFS transporter n=1 Tax=unclassified Mycobacterium TaxID=2642494 RepID=UPI001F0B43B6|nr:MULTISPECIES: MFS transporter [unclassified Mycobacterium]